MLNFYRVRYKIDKSTEELIIDWDNAKLIVPFSERWYRKHPQFQSKRVKLNLRVSVL